MDTNEDESIMGMKRGNEISDPNSATNTTIADSVVVIVEDSNLITAAPPSPTKKRDAIIQENREKLAKYFIKRHKNLYECLQCGQTRIRENCIDHIQRHDIFAKWAADKPFEFHRSPSYFVTCLLCKAKVMFHNARRHYEFKHHDTLQDMKNEDNCNNTNNISDYDSENGTSLIICKKLEETITDISNSYCNTNQRKRVKRDSPLSPDHAITLQKDDTTQSDNNMSTNFTESLNESLYNNYQEFTRDKRKIQSLMVKTKKQKEHISVLKEELINQTDLCKTYEKNLHALQLQHNQTQLLLSQASYQNDLSRNKIKELEEQVLLSTQKFQHKDIEINCVRQLYFNSRQAFLNEKLKLERKYDSCITFIKENLKLEPPDDC